MRQGVGETHFFFCVICPPWYVMRCPSGHPICSKMVMQVTRVIPPSIPYLAVFLATSVLYILLMLGHIESTLLPVHHTWERGNLWDQGLFFQESHMVGSALQSATSLLHPLATGQESILPYPTNLSGAICLLLGFGPLIGTRQYLLSPAFSLILSFPLACRIPF